ncbi:MAG TPA: hypothetical protein VF249_08985 [Arthrobacter sp.]
MDHPGQARRCAAAARCRGKDADDDGSRVVADGTASTASLDCRTGTGAFAVTFAHRAVTYSDRAVTVPDPD